MSAIGSFLTSPVKESAEVILRIIAKIVITMLNVIVGPIDAIIQRVSPDLSGILSNISNFFNVILTGPVSYFLSILDNFPYLKSAIRISLSFDIIFFSTIGVYYLIQGTIVVIAKLKAMIH